MSQSVGDVELFVAQVVELKYDGITSDRRARQ